MGEKTQTRRLHTTTLPPSAGQKRKTWLGIMNTTLSQSRDTPVANITVRETTCPADKLCFVFDFAVTLLAHFRPTPDQSYINNLCLIMFQCLFIDCINWLGHMQMKNIAVCFLVLLFSSPVHGRRSVGDGEGGTGPPPTFQRGGRA